MLVKSVILFLLAMAVVAMVGRVLFPNRPGPMAGILKKPSTCAKCGRYVLGRQGCDCGKPKQR